MSCGAPSKGPAPTRLTGAGVSSRAAQTQGAFPPPAAALWGLKAPRAARGPHTCLHALSGLLWRTARASAGSRQGGGFRGALAGKGLGLGQGSRASLGRTEAALFSPLMGPAFPPLGGRRGKMAGEPGASCAPVGAFPEARPSLVPSSSEGASQSQGLRAELPTLRKTPPKGSIPSYTSRGRVGSKGGALHPTPSPSAPQNKDEGPRRLYNFTAVLSPSGSNTCPHFPEQAMLRNPPSLGTDTPWPLPHSQGPLPRPPPQQA